MYKLHLPIKDNPDQC